MTPLIVRPTIDDMWMLEQPLSYSSDLLNGIVTVPAGFETDFASVPRFMPILFAIFSDAARESSVVHDYLIEIGTLDRVTIDNVFMESMQVSGVGWKRYPMYAAVSVWRFFRKVIPR